MKLSETVMPMSEVKANASKVLEAVAASHIPVIITKNGHARAIIQDLQSYEQTQESLAMLKIVVQGRNNVRQGRFKPLRKAFDGVRKRVRADRSA